MHLHNIYKFFFKRYKHNLLKEWQHYVRWVCFIFSVFVTPLIILIILNTDINHKVDNTLQNGSTVASVVPYLFEVTVYCSEFNFNSTHRTYSVHWICSPHRRNSTTTKNICPVHQYWWWWEWNLGCYPKTDMSTICLLQADAFSNDYHPVQCEYVIWTQIIIKQINRIYRAARFFFKLNNNYPFTP